jgi:hypothetical protein
MVQYKIKNIADLPNWKKTLYEDIPLVDTNYRELLKLKPQGYSYKIPNSKKEIVESEVKIVKIELEKNKPIKVISALKETAQKSHQDAKPCILLIGEDFNEMDFWSKIFSSIGLMGYPLEFAMGTATQPATIEITPKRNEIIRVAFWVLRGDLKPLPKPKPKAAKITKEATTTKPKKTGGMDFKALAEDPVNIFVGEIRRSLFYQAWQGKSYDLEKNPQWLFAPLECSIVPGTKEAPHYKDLIAFLQKQQKISSKQLSRHNENQTRWFRIKDRIEKQMDVILEKVNSIKALNSNIINSPLFQIRMKSLAEHPSLTVSLLQNKQKYKKWQLNEIRASYVLKEIAAANTQMEILENHASVFLAEFLPRIGAFDAIVVTKEGMVTASSSKNFQLNIWEDSNWAVLEQFEDEKTILVSDPKREPVLECNYVVCAVPLKDEGETNLGWVLIKVTIGK